MIFTYILGPSGYLGEGEYGYGEFDNAAISDLRYKIAKLFWHQSRHQLQFKCGYGEEQIVDSFEASFTRKGSVLILPSRIKLKDTFQKSDIYFIERPSTPLFEIGLTKRNIVCYIADKNAFNQEFLKALETRAEVSYSKKNIFLLFNKLLSLSDEGILNFFRDKNESTDFKKLIIGNNSNRAIERITSFILGNINKGSGKLPFEKKPLERDCQVSTL